MSTPVSTPVLDTRLLGKPSKFSGNIGDWAQWKFQVSNYLQLVDADLPDEIEAAMAKTEPITVDPAQNPTLFARGRTLYAITVSLLSPGRPMTLARSVRSRSGWELWRLLGVEYEPARSSRALV